MRVKMKAHTRRFRLSRSITLPILRSIDLANRKMLLSFNDCIYCAHAWSICGHKVLFTVRRSHIRLPMAYKWKVAWPLFLLMLLLLLSYEQKTNFRNIWGYFYSSVNNWKFCLANISVSNHANLQAFTTKNLPPQGVLRWLNTTQDVIQSNS